jgi:hypothetical protein
MGRGLALRSFSFNALRVPRARVPGAAAGDPRSEGLQRGPRELREEREQLRLGSSEEEENHLITTRRSPKNEHELAVLSK